MRRFLSAAALGLIACQSIQPARTPDRALVELDPKDFPAFADDLDYADLDAAIGNSLDYYARVAKDDPQAHLQFGTEQVPIAKAAQTLEAFRLLLAKKPAAAELRQALAESFRVFQATGDDNDRDVLFTGYYLPELHGAWHEQDPFTVPLFSPPPGVITAHASEFPQLQGEDIVGSVNSGVLEPLPTRAEIAAGAFKGKGLELVWIDSVLDAFFLEVQGSGIVKFRDGSSRVLTYAGKNGRPYTSIGAELVKRGVLEREDVSMQTIRAWLDAHPAERDGLLNLNESQTFFRLSPVAEGAIGTPITAGRTVATDTRVFPKGALGFVETERPESVTSDKWRKFSRFVLDQDTGGGIRAAAHVDVFWGSGDYAAKAAGHMKQLGKMYYLLAK